MHLRLQGKLIALMLLAATLPLGLAGLTAIRITQRSAQSQIREAHLRVAAAMAGDLQQDIDDRLAQMRRSAGAFDVAALTDEEWQGALRLVYRQVEGVAVVAALDSRGHILASPVSLQPDAVVPEALASRSVRTVEATKMFVERIPLEDVLEEGQGIGAPYGLEDADGPRIPLAVRADGWILAVELPLADLQERLDSTALGSSAQAFVVGPQRRVIAHRDRSRLGTTLAEHPFFGASGRNAAADVGRSPFSDDEALLTFVALGSLDWGVGVSEPTSEAFVAARRLRMQTLFWMAVSLVLAVGLGLFYARQVTRPVGTLTEGARALAKGNLDHEIHVETSDELHDLAAAFNQMAADLQRSMKEIEAWNEELAERVEKRTQELAQAQAELFQSRKLAAVGELGGGVAHELNNPLTAVVGFANILLEKHGPDHPDYKKIRLIHDAGARCAEIIDSLLRFSESAKQGKWDLVDLNQAVRDAINVLPKHVEDNPKLEIDTDLEADLPMVYGSSSELRTVVYQLLTNALRAMPEGGGLSIRTVSEGEHVVLEVADTGEGMDQETAGRIFDPFFTRNRPENKGLGLSVLYGIVRDHDGDVGLRTAPGEGATFTVTLPSADSSKKARAARLTPEDVAAPSEDVA